LTPIFYLSGSSICPVGVLSAAKDAAAAATAAAAAAAAAAASASAAAAAKQRSNTERAQCKAADIPVLTNV